MTYRELLKKLQAMPDDRLDDDVTVFDPAMDEYHAIQGIGIADEENGVLDDKHRFLVLAGDVFVVDLDA